MIHIFHICVFVCFLLIVNGDLRSVVKSFFDFHLTVNPSLRATSSENQQCGFRTDSTQTELYSHISRLETGNFGFIEETVGREIFRFAQHPPHTRFDTMGGFLDQYKELLGTLSPCDMVHLSSRSRYICYPFKPEMCSKFVKYTMNL